VLLSFPFANENVRADLLALQRAGMLSLFCTTIAWRNHPFMDWLLPASVRRELERRAFEGVAPDRIRMFPKRELLRQVARRIGATALIRHETGCASVDRVMQDFDEKVARHIRRRSGRALAVYAYEGAALRTFEAAAEVGSRRFYELPTGYWRMTLRLLKEERELNPEWAPTMEGLYDSAEKHERKDAELNAAEYVVVPSNFVRTSLSECPTLTASIKVISYGAPPPQPRARCSEPRLEKLRLLYVGNLSQQKGISYLFSAMRQLKGAASLTVVGAKSGAHCRALDAALGEHEWLGSVPHDRVLALMAEHDLLVLPSLVEGLSLVILEAMARGMPVIATTNTGGPDVIDDGTDGFVVPIRDSAAITQRVLELHGDLDRLISMRSAALQKAGCLSWATRGKIMVDFMRDRISASDGQVAIRGQR